MGRRVRPELWRANMEARRYVETQHADARLLYYPPITAFAKERSRGTVSLGPTPEDPYLELVGEFFWALPDVERRLLTAHYSTPARVTAHEFDLTVNQYRKRIRRLLTDLADYLRGLQRGIY